MGFDLHPSDEQRALQDVLHELAEQVLRPQARACEEAGRTSAEVVRKVHGIGVATPVPEELGGAGRLDALTHCMAAEELAWGDPGIAYHVLGAGLAAIVLDIAGSDEQRRELLPRLVDPAQPSFVALGERLVVRALAGFDTRLELDKVVGEKYGVVEADAGPFGIVVGRDGEDLAAAVVEPGAFEVIRAEAKLGLEAAPTSLVQFDGAVDRLPGGHELERAILWCKLFVGAIAVGGARASFEYAAGYAKDRMAFGKPIGAFQGISFKIADMATEVAAARLGIWKAAWRLDRGEATYADIAQANAQALAAAISCGDDGVQILGGHGYIRDHPVEKWFRDAVTLSALEAPDVLGSLAGSGARI